MEGVPTAVSEALALGVPVIATNVGGIGSQISHGSNGLIVDDASIQAAFDRVFQDKHALRKLKANAAAQAKAALDLNASSPKKLRQAFNPD